ncbi:MAG TPA: alkaline phosphatase family protein [Candidatus Dormibacteraeota bacterium]
MRRAALACLLLLAACASPAARAPARSAPPPFTPAPAASVAPRTGPLAKLTPHVFVIVMENKSYAEALAQPFTARLAAENAVATNYHAVSHPSLPNYLALTSGSTYGIRDDGYHVLPGTSIGSQLSAAGISWRAYMEGMSANCLAANSVYAIKHDPFAYYGGACPTNVVPMDQQLDADLAAPAAQAPNFSWITPDLCHDGHDCSAPVADGFLAGLVGRILAAPAFKSGGVLFVTWDEDDGGADNRVPLIAVGAGVHTGSTSDQASDHYSLLATIEDLLGVSRLGAAASAQPLADLIAR